MCKRFCRLLLVAIAITTISCASDVANRYYGTEKYPPKPVADVQLLDHAPDRPYNVIADFQSRGESPQDMKKKAAAIGADAVIVTTLGDYAYSQNKEWMQQENPNALYTRIVATAIRFK